MFDVIRAKPKLVLYIVGGAVFLLQSFVRGSWYAMFASSDFDIVQSTCIGLHCSTYFGRVGMSYTHSPLLLRGSPGEGSSLSLSKLASQ